MPKSFEELLREYRSDPTVQEWKRKSREDFLRRRGDVDLGDPSRPSYNADPEPYLGEAAARLQRTGSTGGIRWKWNGKTVTLSNEAPSTYQEAQEAPAVADAETQRTFGRSAPDLEKADRRLSAMEQMAKASPAQKREWRYYMRHALREAKKGEDPRGWLLGLYNTGGVNIDEDGYTWWPGLSEKDAGIADQALDKWLNDIGVWYRDETGKEQFNPYALDEYQRKMNSWSFIESQPKQGRR